jgi:hypothetical protein
MIIWIVYYVCIPPPPQQQTPTQQPQQQKIRPSPKGYLEFSLVLSELKFPMTKSEIIESVKKVKYQENDQETQETMKITKNTLDQLPDDSYNKNKLEREVSNILMRKLKKLGAYEGRVLTIVYDERSKPEHSLRDKQSWVGQIAVGLS